MNCSGFENNFFSTYSGPILNLKISKPGRIDVQSTCTHHRSLQREEYFFFPFGAFLFIKIKKKIKKRKKNYSWSTLEGGTSFGGIKK